MKITLLGTGTSTGVPQIGCECEVCTSVDTRDKRLRTSAVVETDTTCILIDCGPDFRTQMLKINNRPFDAVLITHEHSDHIGGLDDLRPDLLFGEVNIYSNARTLAAISERMSYCFREPKYPGVPLLALHEISFGSKFSVGDIEIIPFEVLHGEMSILGFRLNNMAYVTDMKSLPEASYTHLNQLELMVVNGLRHHPHLTHQTIEEACVFAQRLNVPQTYLTHLNHQAKRHAQLEQILPQGIYAGYDQQIISF